MAAEESTDVREVGQVDEEAIARKLNGKVLHIVVSGSAGAGKSTLANTLIGKRVFKAEHSSDPVTKETVDEHIEVNLGGKGMATVVIHDTPGITGGRKNDKMVEEELRKIKTLDLLLICLSLDEDGGRYLPSKFNAVFDTVERVYGDDVFGRKAVIVLTKANKASESIDQQAAKDKEVGKIPATFDSHVEKWRKNHMEEQEDSVIGNLPIFTAGQIVMDERTGKPRSIDRVDNSTEWLDVLWCDICKFTTPELVAFLYIWRKKMLEDEEVSPTIKEIIMRWISPIHNQGMMVLAGLENVNMPEAAVATLAAGVTVKVATAAVNVAANSKANVDNLKERFFKKGP